MEYNVMLFEDRVSIRVPLITKIGEKKMNVFACRNVYEANDIWKKNHSLIDAIVLDIMMSSKGLAQGNREGTKAGLLSGWVWLWKELNGGAQDIHPTAGILKIIYTAYDDELKSYIREECKDEKEKAFYNCEDVNIVNKSEDMNEIVKMLESNRNAKAKAQAQAQG